MPVFLEDAEHGMLEACGCSKSQSKWLDVYREERERKRSKR